MSLKTRLSILAKTFDDVSIIHELLPYFTNDDDIHFSAISNQTNFSIDKHVSYITTTTDKHMSYINISTDKHVTHPQISVLAVSTLH